MGEQRRKEQELIDKAEADKKAIADRRRQAAAALPAEDAAATARIAMRLPSGQRVQRKFLSSAKLEEVYAWADCVAYLPENDGKGMEVPPQFLLIGLSVKGSPRDAEPDPRVTAVWVADRACANRRGLNPKWTCVRSSRKSCT